MNESLARRLRKACAGKRQITEKRMFGGACFLLRGNMLCGAGKNGYMLRVGAERHAEAARMTGGRPVVMSGRAMPGFFWVDPDASDAGNLSKWLALVEAYVGALPPKAKSSSKAAPRRTQSPRRPTRRRNSA